MRTPDQDMLPGRDSPEREQEEISWISPKTVTHIRGCLKETWYYIYPSQNSHKLCLGIFQGLLETVIYTRMLKIELNKEVFVIY